MRLKQVATHFFGAMLLTLGLNLLLLIMMMSQAGDTTNHAPAQVRLAPLITAALAVNGLLLPLLLLAFRLAQGRALDAMAGAMQTDLRERDRVQQDLQAARELAEAAAQAKAMFLANMSHEIRTPMNAIMGMTQLALRTKLTPQQRDYLDKASAAQQLLLSLIDDVLDFSRIEAGGMQLEETAFELEAVLSQTIGLVRQQAQDKELELVCEVLDATLLIGHGRLLGDPLRLSQILINLLGNAVKFTPAGQVALRVDTEALPAQAGSGAAPGPRRGLLISVSDTGIGMNASQRDALFSAFAQADASITRRFGGSGLGLTITKRLVDLMGGRIEVHSQAGTGTTCVLHLPLRTPPITTRSAELAPAEAGGTDEPRADGSGLRVLVVDDQRDSLAAVKALLQRLGVGRSGRIACADSGQAALAQLSAAQAAGQAFDLMLLDWVLPDMDGGEVMQAARRLQPGLRIAVMTAYGSAQVAARASAEGCLGQIAKPVLPEDLRRLLQPQRPAAPAARDARPRLDGLRVLLVEDDPLNRQLATELLQQQGATVCCAEHGLEAVARLDADGATAHDVVLMDLQMPVLDGYEAVRRLRQRPGLDRLPILAMTASAMAGERERCLALGMQGHIAKPLDAAALFCSLAAWLPARQHPAGAGAAAATASTASPAPALPRLPGQDSARLLAHCDGNAALARQLLAGFERDHRRGVAHWSALIDRAAWADLRRAAHTLSGLAGTLGAARLQAEAALLEGHAEAADPAASARQLARVDETLAPLLDALAAARLGEAAAPSPASAPIAAGPGPAPDLAELVSLLDHSDSRAITWWQSHAPMLAAQLPPVLLRRLSAAMASYDFDAALQTINKHQASRRAHARPSTLPLLSEALST